MRWRRDSSESPSVAVASSTWRAARIRETSSAMAGRSWRTSRNLSFPRRQHSVSPTAITVARRGSPVSIPISPKMSGAVIRLTIARRCVGDGDPDVSRPARQDVEVVHFAPLDDHRLAGGEGGADESRRETLAFLGGQRRKERDALERRETRLVVAPVLAFPVPLLLHRDEVRRCRPGEGDPGATKGEDDARPHDRVGRVVQEEVGQPVADGVGGPALAEVHQDDGRHRLDGDVRDRLARQRLAHGLEDGDRRGPVVDAEDRPTASRAAPGALRPSRGGEGASSRGRCWGRGGCRRCGSRPPCAARPSRGHGRTCRRTSPSLPVRRPLRAGERFPPSRSRGCPGARSR